MTIQFTNQYTKVYLARRGPVSVFGRDVDTREALEEDAVNLFDQVWGNSLEDAVKNAPECSIDIVFERLFESAKRRVNRSAEHRGYFAGPNDRSIAEEFNQSYKEGILEVLSIRQATINILSRLSIAMMKRMIVNGLR